MMVNYSPEALEAIRRQEREQAEAVAEHGPERARFVRWCPECIMPTTHGHPTYAHAWNEDVQCYRCNCRYRPAPGTLGLAAS